MFNKEVIPAFDMLLEELERIIPDLNTQGKELLDQKQYAQAHELINKAQAVVAFEANVNALKEEWLKLQVPPTKALQPNIAPKPPKDKKIIKRTGKGKLEEGLRTKNIKFHMPILRALVNAGGSMNFGDLKNALERDMKDALNKFDRELLPNGKSIRWENNVGWAKTRLREAGYISATAPKGTWEITPAGREALEDHEKQQASGLLF